MTKRRLLLISYEFPPKGGTQAQSTAKFAMSLVREGWTVDVLTVSDPPTSMLDPQLLSEVDGDLRIHRAFSLEPTRVLQAIRRARSRLLLPSPRGEDARSAVTAVSPSPRSDSRAGGRGYTSLPRWAIRGVQALFWPDEKVGWLPWAVAEGARAARTRSGSTGFVAIMGVGPSFTSYLVAERLAARMRIPWLADLRDPLYGGYFFKPFTPLHAELQRYFERRVVRGAGHVVVVTPMMKTDILSRNLGLEDRITVVPNTFDPSDFAGARPPARPGFVLTYVGTFQATIRPDTLLDAVLQLRGDDHPAGHELRIRFVGARDPETGQAIRDRGLEDIVERTGFMPHSEAVREMRIAGVLLFVLGPEPASRGIQTSKLPEYLAARRPILALVPEGTAAETLRRYGPAEIVHPSDVRGTAEALRRLYAAWKEGCSPEPAEEVVAEFDRAKQAAIVSGILAELIARPSRLRSGPYS